MNEPVWNGRLWDEPPPLNTDVDADVCVVGLGGSGLECIAELVAHGLSVVGIDAGPVGGGAAGRNGGLLLAGTAAFHHDAVAELGAERAVALYRLTLQEMDLIFAELPEIARRTGSLRIATSDEELDDCRLQLARMREDGLPATDYEGPEGRGLLLPTDGVFNPLERCRALAGRVRAAGARLFSGTPAQALDRGEVVTPAGRIRCGATVVAVDGRLEALLPELRGTVRTARLQMLATAPTTEISLPRPVYARWGYEYWQQLPDGSVALGGYRDSGGEAEWTSNAAPSEPVQQALERFLRTHLGVQAPVTHRWAASVSYTSSGMPYVGEVRPGVWATGGYSGTGNVIGAICGRVLAQLVVTGGSDHGNVFLQS